MSSLTKSSDLRPMVLKGCWGLCHRNKHLVCQLGVMAAVCSSFLGKALTASRTARAVRAAPMTASAMAILQEDIVAASKRLSPRLLYLAGRLSDSGQPVISSHSSWWLYKTSSSPRFTSPRLACVEIQRLPVSKSS